MRVPELTTREFRPRRYLVNDHVYVRHRDVIVVSDTRSPVAPEHEVREGTVLVQIPGEQGFVVATDPRAGQPLPAEVASLTAPDASWADTLLTASLSSSGLGFAVRLDSAAVDVATVADQLNRNASFANHFLADEEASGRLRIRTRSAGAGSLLHVQSSLEAAFGPRGVAALGEDPAVVVADDLGELKDVLGRPIRAMVPALAAGHFRTSELIALTPEARLVLTRRGSLFS